MMIAPACKHDQTRKFGKDRKGNPRVQCALCGKTWTVAAPSLLGDMRIDLALAERIIKQLCEGTSIRATARLTNTTKKTVIRLMLLVGRRCDRYLQLTMRGVAVDDVQVDEAWQFIGCKEKTRGLKGYGPEVGDSYIFTAIERNTKLLVAWHFGKRDQWNTDIFCAELRNATSGQFQLSTDGFAPYLSAVVRYLGDRVQHGTVVKNYGKLSLDDQRKYSPSRIIGMKKEAVWNLPSCRNLASDYLPAVAQFDRFRKACGVIHFSARARLAASSAQPPRPFRVE
jgi:transposase-like protein/IS1 family transposase